MLFFPAAGMIGLGVRANTLLSVSSPRDSGLSEGSSGGTSDDDLRRRSGSLERNLGEGQSPEHSAYTRKSVVRLV